MYDNRTADIPSAEDYPPLSALNDLLFCPRRCALHRVEGLWVENAHTQAGTFDHRRVHQPRDAEEGPYRIARGLRLVSHRLRLVGVADLVEFHPGASAFGRTISSSTPSPRPSPIKGEGEIEEQGTLFPEPEGDIPYPIEYKRGKRRRWDNDDVQLCAQALCLEEMLAVPVPRGAIFHLKSRRRREVVFDAALRRATSETAARLHELLDSGVTPPPVLHPKCRQCSLHAICLPELISAPATYRLAAAELFTVADDPDARRGLSPFPDKNPPYKTA